MQAIAAALKILFLVLFALTSVTAIASNRLANHPSPYLEMHSEDPVD